MLGQEEGETTGLGEAWVVAVDRVVVDVDAAVAAAV